MITGTLDCLAFLRRIRPLDVLTVADFQQAHYQMFKRAHPWAGQFRVAGQMVTIAGLPAADPPRICSRTGTHLFPDAPIAGRFLFC